jgi:cobalt-zinc-cadmium efflux system membrane fusion protein
MRALAWVGVALLAGCSRTAPERVTEAAAPGETDLVALAPEVARQGRIAVQEVVRAALPEVLRAPGRVGVDENRTARVGAVSDGRIVRVLANVGDRVEMGQRLAELHSHEVHEARSDYAKAQAEHDRRQAELRYARNARDRAKRLYELKAGSLEHLQRAETDLRHAEMALQAAQADIGRVEEHLHHLGLSTAGAVEEYSEPRAAAPHKYEQEELVPVAAPLAGTVIQRMVTPGAVVSPSTDLFVVSDLTSLWVNAQLPERHLPAVRVGRPVRISVQAYGDTVFAGRITHIGDTLDPETRTVQVRCQTDNASGRLKPEMYATVTFDLGQAQEALVVPTSAIQDIKSEAVVFVRVDETHFRARRVQVGRQADSRTEILEGLQAGEKVATTGSFLLKSELLKGQMAAE